MTNIFCPRCGQSNAAAARFCSACGQAIASEPPAPAVPPLPPQAAPPAPSSPPPLDDRAGVPMPPRLHWALVLLFGLLSCGLFCLAWYFVQSSYVKKLDPKSNATWYLVAFVACQVLATATSALGLLQDPTLQVVGLVAQLGLSVLGLVFFYCAYYAMARSLETVLPRHGLRPWLGGITLFFFHVFYLQGTLRWIARWKETGQTLPNPPKLVFWVLGLVMSLLLGLGVVLALVGAAYGDYAKRARALVGQQEQPVEGGQAELPDAATAEEVSTDAGRPEWMLHEDAADAAADLAADDAASAAAEAARAAAAASWRDDQDDGIDETLPTYPTSFSCGNLRRLQQAEVEICQDAGLAMLDRELASTWAMAQRAVPAAQAAALKQEQLQWLRQRNACGTDRECIDARIMARQADLLEQIGQWR